MSAVVAILTRSPHDPRLKSRLAPVIPDDNARRDLALAFFDDLVDRVRALRGVTLRVAVTAPVEGLRITRPWIPGVEILMQRGVTIGEREANILTDLAAAGFNHIILLAANVPDLPPDRLAQALATLMENANACVIGPSSGGGYHLIGVNVRDSRVPDICTNVRWGSPHELEDTTAAAKLAGCDVKMLDEWHEVEAPEDLAALKVRLTHAPDAAPKTSTQIKGY
jgi:glycosyltransferase A (GT-A) superfamily protein (DUF2064 family)